MQHVSLRGEGGYMCVRERGGERGRERETGVGGEEQTEREREREMRVCAESAISLFTSNYLL